MKINVIFGMIAIFGIHTAMAQSESKIASLKVDALEAKAVFMEKDARISSFFENSAGYVIFPNVGKGGLGVGGAAGTGIVYANGEEIGVAKMKQLTIGFQAGGQAYREVIFFESEEDLDRFKENNFEFTAQVSAVALDKGISADAMYQEGVAVFTLSKKGLMYEASVGGQKFDYTSF
jgi:lipid-binding SYLF domain-containing protein